MKKKSLALLLASSMLLASCGVASPTSSHTSKDEDESQTSIQEETSSSSEGVSSTSKDASSPKSESTSDTASRVSSTESQSSIQQESSLESSSSHSSSVSSSEHISESSSDTSSSYSSIESSHSSIESSYSSMDSSDSSASNKTEIAVKKTGASHADMVANPGEYVVFAGDDKASEYVSAYSVENDVTIEIGSYAQTLDAAVQLALRYHISGIAKDDKYKATATIVTDTDFRLYFSKTVYFDYEAGKEGTLDVEFTYSSNTAFNAVLRNKGTGDNFSGTGIITFKDLVIEKI